MKIALYGDVRQDIGECYLLGIHTIRIPCFGGHMKWGSEGEYWTTNLCGLIELIFNYIDR